MTAPAADGARRVLTVRIVLSLLALYLIWGSTYLGIRIAIASFPPFLMAGSRFAIAGTVLYVVTRRRGAEAPSRAEWLGASLLGLLLIVGGNGGVTFAEQWVPSGLAALGIAAVPLWTALFGGLWGHWPSRMEWAGLALGLCGVVLLSLERDLRFNPIGAAMLLLASMSWALGSAMSHRLAQPKGLTGSAAQMLVGGATLIVLGLASGQRITHTPTAASLAALAYLTVFGSVVAFSAYGYLLRTVRPTLATSYAYVNPAVAVALGVGLAGEHISAYGVAAMVVILAGVGLVALGQRRRAPSPETPAHESLEPPEAA